MNPLRPQTDRAHDKLLREVFAFERIGEFDEALSALRGIWDDTTKEPEVQGLDVRLAAETHLRCGALIGFLGHIRQIPTGQERSKNLLTRARSVFLELFEREKIAECENYLALAYWRTGEIKEAESWIEEARSHDLDETSPIRLYTHVIYNLVLLSEKRFLEVCRNFAALEGLFAGCDDDYLIGSMYNNVGVARKNLGNTEEGLQALETARNLFAATGNRLQVALAENNLSQLYKTQRKFASAHASIDHAIELFRKINDRTREGFSLDTKALIFFEEGKFQDALRTVDQAIGILGKSENFAYLTETIATKAKIQLFSDDFTTATLTLLDAVDLARVHISEASAMGLIRDFEQAFNRRNTEAEADVESGRTGIATGDLKLVLPPNISHYSDYQGVWIKNADLAPYGLPAGSLAVVVQCNVRRGDLVALIEVETDSVSCGFYDADFGIVCLEAGGSEPLLFDQSAVRILGRIVGVSDAKGKPEEPLEVRALDIG